jgi:hypothetical protein
VPSNSKHASSTRSSEWTTKESEAPQPAGLITSRRSCIQTSRLGALFDSLMTLTIGLPRAEEYVYQCFVVPLQACGIPPPPVGNPPDVKVATEDGGEKVAAGRSHGFTESVQARMLRIAPRCASASSAYGERAKRSRQL